MGLFLGSINFTSLLKISFFCNITYICLFLKVSLFHVYFRYYFDQSYDWYLQRSFANCNTCGLGFLLLN